MTVLLGRKGMPVTAALALFCRHGHPETIKKTGDG
jgi:hypothetical protein